MSKWNKEGTIPIEITFAIFAKNKTKPDAKKSKKK